MPWHFTRAIELLSDPARPELRFTASAGASVLVELPRTAPDPHATVLRVTLR